MGNNSQVAFSIWQSQQTRPRVVGFSEPTSTRTPLSPSITSLEFSCCNRTNPSLRIAVHPHNPSSIQCTSPQRETQKARERAGERERKQGIMLHKAAAALLPCALRARMPSMAIAGPWHRPAMAMATKVDGRTSSGIDENSPGANAAEREAYKSDMDESYGDAYSTRSSEEGYGERYGEAVKGVLENKDTTELQRGATAERDQNEESGKQVQYDRSQGEHVEEKETSRHSVQDNAFEDEHAAHKRQEEAHSSEGGQSGGVAT